MRSVAPVENFFAKLGVCHLRSIEECLDELGVCFNFHREQITAQLGPSIIASRAPAENVITKLEVGSESAASDYGPSRGVFNSPLRSSQGCLREVGGWL